MRGSICSRTSDESGIYSDFPLRFFSRRALSPCPRLKCRGKRAEFAAAGRCSHLTSSAGGTPLRAWELRCPERSREVPEKPRDGRPDRHPQSMSTTADSSTERYTSTLTPSALSCSAAAAAVSRLPLPATAAVATVCCPLCRSSGSVPLSALCIFLLAARSSKQLVTELLRLEEHRPRHRAPLLIDAEDWILPEHLIDF